MDAMDETFEAFEASIPSPELEAVADVVKPEREGRKLILRCLNCNAICSEAWEIWFCNSNPFIFAMKKQMTAQCHTMLHSTTVPRFWKLIALPGDSGCWSLQFNKVQMKTDDKTRLERFETRLVHLKDMNVFHDKIGVIRSDSTDLKSKELHLNLRVLILKLPLHLLHGLPPRHRLRRRQRNRPNQSNQSISRRFATEILASNLPEMPSASSALPTEHLWQTFCKPKMKGRITTMTTMKTRNMW